MKLGANKMRQFEKLKHSFCSMIVHQSCRTLVLYWNTLRGGQYSPQMCRQRLFGDEWHWFMMSYRTTQHHCFRFGFIALVSWHLTRTYARVSVSGGSSGVQVRARLWIEQTHTSSAASNSCQLHISSLNRIKNASEIPLRQSHCLNTFIAIVIVVIATITIIIIIIIIF